MDAEKKPSGKLAAPGTPYEPASFVSFLSRTLAEANRFIVEQLKQRGLSDLVPSHGDILVHLFAHEPVTMQELAQAINRDPSTVTALVRKLSDAGYVRTAKAADDKRVTKASLTDKGAGLREDFDGISAKLLETQMQGIDDGDFDTACNVLNRVRDNFAKALDAGNKHTHIDSNHKQQETTATGKEGAAR